MTSSLATKMDLQHHEELIATRLEALEGRVSLMIQNQESRIITRLGALMALLLGIASTVLALTR